MSYRKVKRPDADTLAAMLRLHNDDLAATARAFDVDPRTIERWAKKLDIGIVVGQIPSNKWTDKVQAGIDGQGAHIHRWAASSYIGADTYRHVRAEDANEEDVYVSSPTALLPRRPGKYTLDYATAPAAGVLLGTGRDGTFGNGLLRVEPNGIDWVPDHGLSMLAVLAAGMCQLDLESAPTTADGEWSLVRRVYLDIPSIVAELGWPPGLRSNRRLIGRIQDLGVPWFRLGGKSPIRFIVGRSESIHTRPRGAPSPQADRARWLASWVDIRWEFFTALSPYQLDWDLLRTLDSDLARRLVVMLTTDKRLTIPAPILVSPSSGMPPRYYRDHMAEAHDQLREVGFLDAAPEWQGIQVTYHVDADHRGPTGRRSSPLYLPGPVRAMIGQQYTLHPIDREDLRRVAARALANDVDPLVIAHSLYGLMTFGSQSAASIGAVWEHRLKNDAQYTLSASERARVLHLERLYLEDALPVGSIPA